MTTRKDEQWVKKENHRGRKLWERGRKWKSEGREGGKNTQSKRGRGRAGNEGKKGKVKEAE